MKTLIVERLDGIKLHFQEDLYQAMTSCNNRDRLLVCLYFMSDLPDARHSLSEIEQNLREIFPPSLRGGKLPDDYVDFPAAMIRHQFNAETRRVERGQLSLTDRLWAKPRMGCWRNTDLGNRQAIQILQEQGLVVERGGAVLLETDLPEGIAEEEPEEKVDQETEDLSEEESGIAESVTSHQAQAGAFPDVDASSREHTGSMPAEGVYQQAFATLLGEVETVLQESLARHNTATLAGDFETVEIEGERQESLNNARNQLQVLQEIWPELVGEQKDSEETSSPVAEQAVQVREPPEDSAAPRKTPNWLIPLVAALLLALMFILVCGALVIWLLAR